MVFKQQRKNNNCLQTPSGVNYYELGIHCRLLTSFIPKLQGNHHRHGYPSHTRQLIFEPEK